MGLKHGQNGSKYPNVNKKWIQKIRSKKPYGMTKRRDLPLPITFSLKYMDKLNACN